MQRITPIVLNLIIINVLVGFAQRINLPFDITEWGSLHYFTSSYFKPHQLITNMFFHDPDGWRHLLFNMLGLWMFGTMLETYLGSKRFLVFYLVCGLGASLLIQLTVPYSAALLAKSAGGLEMLSKYDISVQQLLASYKNEYSALGASGAIMGVMAAFAYLFPNTEMYEMLIPVPIKAKYLIPVYILVDLFGGLYRFPGDKIGHFAHLGGALVGFLLIRYWNKTNRRTFY